MYDRSLRAPALGEIYDSTVRPHIKHYEVDRGQVQETNQLPSCVFNFAEVHHQSHTAELRAQPIRCTVLVAIAGVKSIMSESNVGRG